MEKKCNTGSTHNEIFWIFFYSSTMSSRGRGFIPRGGGSYRGRGGGGGNEWSSGSTGGNMSGRGGYSSSRGGRFKYSTTSYDSRSKYNSGNVQMSIKYM